MLVTHRAQTRPAKRALQIIAAATLMFAGSAAAQDSTEPDLGIDVLMPQRSIRPAGEALVTTISAVDVDVRLSNTLATTHIEIMVENHGSSTTQARLVLPVPEGSTIRSFGIDGLGDEPTAKLLPREEATQRYNEIVRKMIDPGLLEFVGNAMIQSSVFPVEPGEARTMTIVYEQSLDAHRGRVEYVLPRSASYTNSSIKWSVDIDLESVGAMGPVFSPSHPIVSKIVSDRSMKVGVPMLNEPGAFRLYAVLGTDDAATTLLYPDADNPRSGYFMFVADAPLVDPSAGELMPREVTIVMDRSGSMSGEKMDQARESAKQIVSGMRLGEYVHIIDYAEDVRSFADGPVEITKQSRPNILAYIDNIQSRGGTNLHDALVEAMSASVTENTLPMVLFLTDGLPTIGETNEATIRQHAKDANTQGRRVFAFGVGYDVNVPLLDGISMDTKGESTFVLPDEDVEMKVGQVFDKLDGPVVIDPKFGSMYTKIRGTKPDLWMVEPTEIGDLFSGSRVIVVGRYNDMLDEPALMWVGDTEPGQIKLDKSEKGTNLAARYHPNEASVRNSFVARLWAQRRMDSLIYQIRLAGADGSEPDKELVDEIVRLSLEHGIMSEYTAFLAEEDFGIETANAPMEDGRSSAAGEATGQIQVMNSQRSGKSAFAQTANRKNADAEMVQSSLEADESEYSDYSIQLSGAAGGGGAIKANTLYDDQMNRVQIQTIQRGHGSTMYKKMNQWVDAGLGVHADAEPEITIAFGDDEYWALVDDLAAQGRQWIIANRGDVYFMNHSKRVLVRNPK